MIVKLNPASSDRMVWQVAVRVEGVEVPVDYIRVGEAERNFLGAGGCFIAEPDADGWDVKARTEV